MLNFNSLDIPGIVDFDFIGVGGNDISPLNYKGTYDAATNTPTLANGVGQNGDFYYVTVAGSNNPTGQFLAEGQSIVYNGTTGLWQAGSSISSSTDDVIVSTNYQLEPNTQVQVGQTTTFALGSLQAQIDALSGTLPLVSVNSAVSVSMSNTSTTYVANGFYSITNTSASPISLICTGTRRFLNVNFGNTVTTLVIPAGATVVFTLPSASAVVLLSLTSYSSQASTSELNIASPTTLSSTQLPQTARLVVTNTATTPSLLTLPNTYTFSSDNFPLEMNGTNTTFLIAARSNLTLETYGSTTVYVTSYGSGAKASTLDASSSSTLTALINSTTQKTPVNGEIFSIINSSVNPITITSSYIGYEVFLNCTSTNLYLSSGNIATLQASSTAGVYYILNITSSNAPPVILQDKAASFTSSDADTTYSAGFLYAITNTSGSPITMTLTGTRVFANTTFGNTSTVLTINAGQTATIESISTTKLIILSLTDAIPNPALTLIDSAVDITSSESDTVYVAGNIYSVTNTAASPITFTCTGTRIFHNTYFGNTATVLTIPAGETAILDVSSANTIEVTSLSSWNPLGNGVAENIPIYDANGEFLEDSGKYFDDTETTANNIWSALQTQSAITTAFLNIPTLPIVRVATTANITLANTQTVDGVALAAGDYVLVKNQTISGNNGIWRVVSGGPWVRQAYIGSSYADVTTETTYDELNINGGVVNVLAGTQNKNLQFQIEVQNPAALFGASDVYVTAQTKIPVASPNNRFQDSNIGNNTLNNGSSAFPYLTIAQCLVGASFPCVINMAPTGAADPSAISWTSAQSNTLVQSQNTTANAGQSTITGVQTFLANSTRIHFKGTTHSTGASAPFVFQNNASYRNYFQSLAIITTASDWLGLHSSASNFISLDDIDTSSSPLTAINLPAFTNQFTINIYNQTNSALYFTGTGAANTVVNIFNSTEGTVRLPSGYLGVINWYGQTFGYQLGSSAVPSGLITNQTQLNTVLAYNADTAYDGFYAITGFTPTSYENGAIFGKQTGFGITTTWWGRKYASAPATVSSVSGVSYQKSNTIDTWIEIGTGSGGGGHQYTNVFYVDPVDGLDTNDGTYDKPWLTLTKAATAPANAVVYLAPGTYTEALITPTNSGVSWIGMCSEVSNFQQVVINTPFTVSSGVLSLENLTITANVIATTTGEISITNCNVDASVTIDASSLITLNNCTATSASSLDNSGTLVANGCSKLEFDFTLQTGSTSNFYNCNYVSSLVTSAAGTVDINASNSNFYSDGPINPAMLVNATVGASNVVLKNVNLYNSTEVLNSGIVDFTGTGISGSLVNLSFSNVQFNEAGSSFTFVFAGNNTSYFDGISLTNPLSVTDGGTGRFTLDQHSILVGDGDNDVGLLAPGTAGNSLLSDGTSWLAAPINYSFNITTSGTILDAIDAAGYTALSGAIYQIINTSTSTQTLTCTGLNGSVSYPANATGVALTLLPQQMALVQCSDAANDLFNLYNVSNQEAGGNVFIAKQAFSQSVPTSTNTKINLGNAVADPLGQLTNSNSRFQPTTAGYYQINANVQFAQNSTGERSIWLMQNGTIFAALGNIIGANPSATTNGIVSSVIYLNGTTDYIELFVFQSSGGNLNVGAGNTSMSGFLILASGGNIPSNSVSKATVSTFGATIPNNTQTKVILPVKTFDPNNWYNTSTSRFQPNQEGYYLFTGTVELYQNTGNFAQNDSMSVSLYKNGISNNTLFRANGATNTTYMSTQINDLIYLNGSTDYVELYVFKISSGTVVVNDNPKATYLTCALVGGSGGGEAGSSNYTISTGVSGTIPATITAAGLTDSVGATFSILNTSTTTTLTLTATTISGFTAYPANANLNSVSLPPGQSALIETEILGSRYRLISVGGQNVSANLFTSIINSQGPIGSGVNVLMNFVEVNDPLNQFDNVNHFFRPATAGWYQINATVMFDSNAVGARIAMIYKNGTEYIRSQISATSSQASASVSTLLFLNGTTDYVQVYAAQTSGGALGITLTNPGCSFSGFLVMSGSNEDPVTPSLFPRFGSRPAQDSIGYMFISGESIYTVGAGANNGNWLPYGVLQNNFTPTVAPINNTGNAITGWVDLYSDYENAIALTDDGRVFAVGSFYATNVWQQVNFPGGAIISKIFSALARNQYSGISYYAIDNTGKLYSWGNNLWGQLGLNNTSTQSTPQLVTALSSKVIVDLAASGNNGLSVVALDNTGQIYTWGYNSNGAAANGSPIGNGNIGTNVLTPYTVLGMNDVARISAGGDFNGEALNFTRVIKNDGTSWATGTNYYGVLGLGNTTGRTVFTQEVLGKTNWVNVGAIAVYRGASYAIDATGTLYFCGRNHDGCFGIPAQVNQNILTFTAPTAPFQGKMLQGSSSVKPKVIAGGNSAQGYNVVAVIDNTGTLYTCGANDQGQCGVGVTATTITTFRKVIGVPSSRKVVDVISTGYGNAACGLIIILDDGSIMACGKADYGAQGNTVSPSGNIIPVFQYVIGYAPQNINY